MCFNGQLLFVLTRGYITNRQTAVWQCWQNTADPFRHYVGSVRGDSSLNKGYVVHFFYPLFELDLLGLFFLLPLCLQAHYLNLCGLYHRGNSEKQKTKSLTLLFIFGWPALQDICKKKRKKENNVRQERYFLPFIFKWGLWKEISDLYKAVLCPWWVFFFLCNTRQWNYLGHLTKKSLPKHFSWSFSF